VNVYLVSSNYTF